MSNTVRRPTAKKVFSAVRPTESKHVDVHFDRVIRVNRRTRADGLIAKMDGNPFVIVIYQGDTFAVPFTVKTSQRQADKALGGLLKTRGIDIATL